MELVILYGKLKITEIHALRCVVKKLDDFTVLVGVLASGSLAINLYLIKSVANLCEKVGRLDGRLNGLKHDLSSSD